MWTPKRVVILVIGFVALLAGYLVYAHYLGGINGLPPLPNVYWPRPGDDDRPLEPIQKRTPLLVKRLKIAFGEDCEEARRPFKIEVKSRNLVLAFDEFQIVERTGELKLTPLSVAVFSKKKGADGLNEINTIKGDVAHLRFERPIKTLADMGRYKIVAGHIAGKVKLRNNRRTQKTDDDLVLEVPTGTLYYDQALEQMWTPDFVRMTDYQSKPKPNDVDGRHLIVDLAKHDAPMIEAKKKKEPSSNTVHGITGVRKITLKGWVKMNLYVDSSSVFLSAPADKKKAKKKKNPQERSHVQIKTHGPFVYDMETDVAQFKIPEQKGGLLSQPEYVKVTRTNPRSKLPPGEPDDYLHCDHLVLQFRRRDSKKQQKKANDGALNLQIETATATGSLPGSVVLVSNSEKLVAQGNYLFYHAHEKRTVLRGPKMDVLKDGNRIYARELRIIEQEQGQKMTAIGPGKLLLTKKKGTEGAINATWSHTLTSAKDPTGKMEIIHLVGNASFGDVQNEQSLRADDLTLWLEPKPKTNKSKKQSDEKSDAYQPKRVIAIGHVQAHTPEVNIYDTSRFEIHFEDAPQKAKAKVEEKQPIAKPIPPPGAYTLPPVKPKTLPTPPALKKKEEKPAKKKKNPIYLRARTVEAYVYRLNGKNELDHLQSEGSVHVQQAPEKAGENGVDIKGDHLHLKHHPEGNILKVKSDTDDLARLVMGQITILGPQVTIDQVRNQAYVFRDGAMTIESETDFQGRKLKKSAPLTIHWKKSMFFDGNSATFYGDIQADQNNSLLTCEVLRVVFDKRVSLKRGDSSKGAKVHHLLCEKAVQVEDSLVEKGKFVKSQRLRGFEVSYDNKAGVVRAKGPGDVRIIQIEPDKAKAAKSKMPFKMTYVMYHRRMYANDQSNTVKFYSNVRVLYSPVANRHVEVNLAKVLAGNIPDGAMYIRSDVLELYRRPKAQGKPNQELNATGRVSVRAREFYGTADKMTYNEEKDQVIFEGGTGSTATLFKRGRPGAPWQKVDARKIIYIRKTGQHQAFGVKGASR